MIRRGLGLAARWGRALLVLGLLAGLSLPGLAAAFRPWLPGFVALLLFLAALRVGPREALGALRDLPGLVGLIGLGQLALPLGLIALLALTGLLQSPVSLALLLVAAAPPIGGAPNLTLLMGGRPALPLRILILGTALLPLTILPIFALSGQFGAASEIGAAVARLLLVIGAAAGLGFLLRAGIGPTPSEPSLCAIDGASALTMALMVVGLMGAVPPAFAAAPLSALAWLALACAANLGLQIAAHELARRSPFASERIGLGICGGNRNVALFLAALPASMTDPILIFIGCYQVPMYLTPILMRRIYRYAPPQA